MGLGKRRSRERSFSSRTLRLGPKRSLSKPEQMPMRKNYRGKDWPDSDRRSSTVCVLLIHKNRISIYECVCLSHRTARIRTAVQKRTAGSGNEPGNGPYPFDAVLRYFDGHWYERQGQHVVSLF